MIPIGQLHGRKLPAIGLASWIAGAPVRAAQIPSAVVSADIQPETPIASPVAAGYQWRVVDTRTALVLGEPFACASDAWLSLSLHDVARCTGTHHTVERVLVDVPTVVDDAA